MSARRALGAPLLAAWLLGIGFAAGCSDRKAAEAPLYAPSAAYMAMRTAPADERAAGGPVAPGMDAAAAPLPAARRTLIRNASLSLVVTNVDSAATAAERFVLAAGGFIAASTSRHAGEYPVRNMTLRVPAARLDTLLVQLRSLAVRVETQSVETQDVTDHVVDLEARLRTLRTTEAELLGLLRETRGRGGKTEDIMAVHRELTGIRTQIEQYEGSRRTLDELAALSTVRVEFMTDAAARPIASTGWRPGATARNSLRLLTSALRGLADFGIFAVIVLLPLGLLAAAVGWLLRRPLRGLLARFRPRPRP